MVLATDPYVWGTGRRKTAVARVRIKAGTGNVTVNGKAMGDYFNTKAQIETVRGPLIATESNERYDIWVNVNGGGMDGQAGAVRMGLARCLVTDNPPTEAVLREKGYLTRDSRMVERKKPGLHKARKASQYSKR
ncbi:MAG: 30S ribosomal protein S9 [Planctomycetes bacterium]|jgi:small subunit ribosomal protein S9|nr:30S ribosomal protein S9 [Planctomycetota bacterium]